MTEPEFIDRGTKIYELLDPGEPSAESAAVRRDCRAVAAAIGRMVRRQLANYDRRVLTRLRSDPRRLVWFAAGEPVHVSASRKYTRDGLAELADLAGWTVDDVLTDSDHRVAVALLRI